MKAVAEFSTRFSELIDGMSFTKIGADIGMSKQTVSAYAKGSRNPKKPTISAIATHFGVNPLWLIGFDVPKYIEKPTPVSESGPRDPVIDRIMDIVIQMSPEVRGMYLSQLELLLEMQAKGLAPDIRE